MKLDEVLKAAPKVAEAQDHAVLYLHGAIEADHDTAYFRLYRNPQNRRAYLLVRKAEVAGDLHEWTAEETRQAGFVGTKVYRVPLMFGTELQNVSIAVHKLGETPAAKAAGCPASRRTGGKKSRNGICCTDDSACEGVPSWYEEGSCGEHGQYPCNPGVCGM